MVKGTIQNGPLVEHTSYSGGDKTALVTQTMPQDGWSSIPKFVFKALHIKAGVQVRALSASRQRADSTFPTRDPPVNFGRLDLG
jgi:hypothetical protein